MSQFKKEVFALMDKYKIRETNVFNWGDRLVMFLNDLDDLHYDLTKKEVKNEISEFAQIIYEANYLSSDNRLILSVDFTRRIKMKAYGNH